LLISASGETFALCRADEPAGCGFRQPAMYIYVRELHILYRGTRGMGEQFVVTSPDLKNHIIYQKNFKKVINLSTGDNGLAY
jgi:hypothetical protein